MFTKLITLFTLCLVTSGTLSAQAIYHKDSTKVANVELSCLLTYGDVRVSDYSLLLYCDSNVADTIVVDKKKVVYVQLAYNHNYTLRFVKPGYRDRILLVNTAVDVNTSLADKSFDFEIALVREDQPCNTFADLPVALVRYDPSLKKFDYSKKYHRQVREQKRDGIITKN